MWKWQSHFAAQVVSNFINCNWLNQFDSLLRKSIFKKAPRRILLIFLKSKLFAKIWIKESYRKWILSSFSLFYNHSSCYQWENSTSKRILSEFVRKVVAGFCKASNYRFFTHTILTHSYHFLMFSIVVQISNSNEITKKCLKILTIDFFLNERI